MAGRPSYEELLERLERAEAELAALREAVEAGRFGAFMKHIPAAVFIKDAEGRCLFVNEYMKEVFGAGDWVGRKPEDHFPGDAARAVEEADREALEKGFVCIEETLTNGHGLERVFETRKFPILREGGPPLLGGIALDVTARRRREEMERHARELNEAVAEASLRYLETGSLRDLSRRIVDHAVQLTGAAFGALLALDGDRAELLAVSPMAWRTMEGKALYEEARRRIEESGAFPLEVSDNLVFAAARTGRAVLANEACMHPSWRGSIPEGHPPVENFLAVPLKIGEKIVGVVALANKEGGFTGRDLRDLEIYAYPASVALSAARGESDRACLEEQFRQAQKMETVGRLAGGVAHDFNNLLTVIQNHAAFLEEDIETGSPQAESLQAIQEAARRGAMLTRQLLALSRRHPMQVSVIDLGAVIKGMEKMLRRLLGEDVALEVAVAEDLGMIEADETLIEQVILNLAVNARDAMPGGGVLAIGTENVDLDEEAGPARSDDVTAGQWVVLSVRDSGVGMDDKTRKRIFEPFFTTKERGKGTGLGLATVYGIVRQNGGFIQVESEPGRGTVFRIYFPRIAKAWGEERREAPGPAVEGGTETVLIVEDDEMVRRLAARILRRQGYRVIETAGGEEALCAAADHAWPIHLLLTDVVMPGMSGRELADRLRAERPGLKVLYCTGYTEETLGRHGVFDPGTALIPKPFTPDQLARKVRETIGRASRPGEG